MVDKAELIGWMIVFPIILLVVGYCVHTFFIEVYRADCDAYNGSFTIMYDGIWQTSVCEYSTHVQSMECYKNGEMVDCEK